MPARRGGTRHRLGLRVVATLGIALVAVVAVLVGLGLSGRSIPLPELAVTKIEARANALLGGRGELRIGGGDIVVFEGFAPPVLLTQVTLLGSGGQRLATVADLRSSLDTAALVEGRLVPAALSVRGARVAVRRMPDGTYDVAPGVPAMTGRNLSPAEILDAVDTAFAAPGLARLETVTVSGLDVLFDDRRAGQIWRVSDGQLNLMQSAGALSADLRFGVAGQTTTSFEAPGSDSGDRPRAMVALAVTTDKASPAAKVSADLWGISARDLARQIPGLVWIGAADAPISGTLRSGLDGSGAIEPLALTLKMGQGALRPGPATPAVPFDGAEIDVVYDPSQAALTLNTLSIASPDLRARLSGHATLKGGDTGLPTAVVAQIHLSELTLARQGVFADPVSISQGAADLKLELDPFVLTLGQLTMTDHGRTMTVKGEVAAREGGWRVSLDAGMPSVDRARLISLWPLMLAAKTRDWVAANVLAGDFADLKAAVRIEPGSTPRVALDFRFAGAEVRYMRALPPMVAASGYGSLHENRFVLVAEKGRIDAPKGGPVDIAGSVLVVGDVRQKPAELQIDVKSRGSITSALSLIDLPPLSVMKNAGRPSDLAEGTVDGVTHLRFTPKKGMTFADVHFSVEATARDASTRVIVPGRLLAFPEAAVRADNGGIVLSGEGTLDGVPVAGSWSKRFAPGAASSVAQGTIEITPEALDTFAIALPEGAVRGSGTGRFVIDITRDKPAEYRMDSDLAGLTLAIPQVGWRKASDETGTLEVIGRFATPPEVDRIALDAAGLVADGKLRLKPDGSLDAAEFAAVDLDGWFKGGVVFAGRGSGKTVAIDITGGSADLRRSALGGEGGASGDIPVSIALDRLQITEGIALAPFFGTFTTAGGMSGRFGGRVNGQSAVEGEMSPAANGRSAFRILSDDAGGVMAAAGLYESGRGGELDMTLMPRDRDGHYDGTVGIRRIRVVDAPALASLLNAVSVVGLINELQGAGIVFSDVIGRFLLTPDGVEIREGSAIGPSLGVSAEGVYLSGEDRFDLQGVVSPLYLVNGIGQIVSRHRDGLFGFNYTLKGTREAYNVGVNPLSILTPGLFREIFRATPPKMPDETGG